MRRCPQNPIITRADIPDVHPLVVDEYDEEGFATPESLVRVYYGAADTAVGLATATVNELLQVCD